MKNNLDELMLVLEKIRKEKHPDIPQDVIKHIVEIQRSNQENSVARQGMMRNYLDQITDELGDK